jgi:hypothetical protein
MHAKVAISKVPGKCCGSALPRHPRLCFSNTHISCFASPQRSVLEGNPGEVALTPNQPALPDGAKIVEGSGGRTLMLSSRIPAPILVTSRMLQPNTPRWAPKNSKALFAIFVLPTDLRSLWVFIRILSKLFIDPMAPVMAPPDFSVKQSPRNRTFGNNNGPQMPNFGPRRHRPSRNQLIDVVAICDHAQPEKTKPPGGV